MKKIALLLTIVLMLSCLVGCDSKDPNVTNPTEQTNQNASESTESTEPTVNDVEATQPKVEFNPVVSASDTFVWEKEYQDIDARAIVVGSDWMNKIQVGGADILSSEMSDVSKTLNYYYTPTMSYGDLQTMYYVPTIRQILSSRNVTIGTFSTLKMQVDCTTYVDNNDGVITRTAIIEKVKLGVETNAYEGGLDEVQSIASFADGEFGIGSKYKDVSSIIGEATNVFSEDPDELLHTSMYVYTSDHAEMMLTFMWGKDEALDDATLVEITWIPTSVRAVLRSQTGLELFENYNNVYKTSATTTNE